MKAIPKNSCAVWLSRRGDSHDVVRVKIVHTKNTKVAEAAAFAEWTQDPSIRNLNDLCINAAVIDYVPYGVLRNGGVL